MLRLRGVALLAAPWELLTSFSSFPEQNHGRASECCVSQLQQYSAIEVTEEDSHCEGQFRL
jgi:hypothetical protein